MNPIYLAPWRIDPVVRDQRAPGELPISLGALARAIAAVLDAAGAPSPGSVGLILSDDGELASLNSAHLGHDGPTDAAARPAT